MKYVITGGAGNISKPLGLQLLKAGHAVTVIGRSAANLKELTDAGAVAAIGSVEDPAFLTSTFTGANAVYAMIPPVHQVTDWKAHIGQVGENYVKAIQESGVKNAVLLSSVGAHLAEGLGPVSGLHRVEKAFATLTDVNVKVLRPAYFYPNLLANIGMIKGMGIMGANFSAGAGAFPIVDPADIASVAAEALLQLDFKGHSIRYIASDEVSTNQIAATIGEAIGKPGLNWVTFTDEQAVNGMIQAGLTEEIAKNYAEMNHSIQTGVMAEDYFKNKPATLGKTKLADFARVFAGIYNA